MLQHDETITWADNDIRPDSKHSSHSSRLHTPFMAPGLADIAEHQSLLPPNYTSVSQFKFLSQPNGISELRRSVSSPNPLSIANSNVQSSYFPHQPPPPRSNPNYTRPRPLNLSRSNSRNSLGPDMPMFSPASGTEYKPLTIGSAEEVTTFLETRFRQLQQLCCKIVAKAWIKVIEPKKQTRYPYNRGEESKPEWWPGDVRHKEPDHLMKPGIIPSLIWLIAERINLLMTLLRCGRVSVERLQLATAEVAAFIPAEKTHLLREIYRVAREEERFRNGDIAGTTKIYVASSAEISPASDEGAPSPLYAESTRTLSHSSASAGGSQLGIPSNQHLPSRPRSAQPSFPVEDIRNNPSNLASMPPAKRQKTTSPQAGQTQHVINYPDMYQQQYYQFPMNGGQPPHALTHSQSQLLYPTHGGQNLRYQQEIKSAPPGQQQFLVYPPDFPSPPPTGGFHTTFPHDQQSQHPPTSHAQNPSPRHSSSHAAPPSFGAAYVAAQQLSSLRETTLQHPSSSGNSLPEPQATPQHTSTNHFLNTRSSPFLPTPLRAAGVPGTGASNGPNVSFSDFLNSPMTAGPAPASDGAVRRIRRGDKRGAGDDSGLDDESSDDEGTINGDRSPTKKA